MTQCNLMFNRQFSHSHDRLQLLLFESLTIDEFDIDKLTSLYNGEGIIFIRLLILPYLRYKLGRYNTGVMPLIFTTCFQ